MDMSRRKMLGAGGLVVAAAGLVSGRTAHASVPEAPVMKDANTQPPAFPKSGPD